MNKTAYITGGSKGIGLGIAEVLVKEGIHVAITARTKSDLKIAEKHLKAIGKGDVLVIQSDVRNLADEERAVQQVIDTWGRLDYCIANAGIGKFSPIDEMSAEVWNSVIGINLTGVFHTVKAAIPALKKSKGYIITMSSLAGTNFFEQGAAYNASKFGVVGFSQAIMLDLRPYEIKVTTIMPGSVATFIDGQTPTEKDAWKIQPEDIGQMVADLIRMNPRTLPSKVEVRPSVPPSARK
ncbi:MAG: SDR family oxidoreductase [Maribacter sp.]|uniref:SDR family oxidoreductase n=1 Tax=Maribacter sp. TaxID=1897614 RepID=UPI003C792A63